MSRLKNFSRNLATSYLQMGVNVVYSLVSVPLVLHWLSKAEFGIWALLVQFTFYANLVDLGINQAISRFLIDHKDDRATGEYGALVKTSALVSAVQGLIVVAVVALIAPWLSDLMRIPVEYRDTFIGVTRWQGVVTGFIFCLNPFLMMLSAHQRMDIQARQAMLGMIVSLVFLALFLATGHGIFSFVYASAISAFISPFCYFWSCHRLGLMPKGGEWGKLSRGRFAEIFRYGKDVFLMNVGINLSTASQTIVVSRAMGLEAAAAWSIGTKVFLLVRQVMYLPTSSALPGLSEMLARKETERLKRRFESLAGFTVSFGVFLGVAYALCNSLFVEVWTHGKIIWSPMNDILLALWLFFTSIQTTHASFLFVSRKIGRYPFVIIAEGLTYILLSILVGYRWGIPGIIICSVACVIIFSCYFSIQKSKQFFQVSVSTLLLDWLRPAFGLAAMLVPLAIALSLVTASLPVVWRLAVHGVAVLCCVPLLLRFGLPREVLADAAMIEFKERTKLYLEGSPALKFLVPVAQYFPTSRLTLREPAAKTSRAGGHGDMNPGISVLIRTFNSARTLPDLLGRLKLEPDDELVIVDSGSTDATLEIARKHRARIILAEGPFNYSRSLNLGFQATSQPWVLVVNSHCIPLVPDLLGAFRAALTTFSPNVVVAYGVCLLVDPFVPVEEPMIFASRDSQPAEQKNVFGGNGLALYRRVWWEKLAFDETLLTGEDLIWFTQALAKGGVASRVPAARVLGRNQGTLRYMFRKGIMETWMDREVNGAPKTTLLQLGIRMGALLKKFVQGRIPFGILMRQSALALGAFLAPVLVNPRRGRLPKVRQARTEGG